MRNNNEDAAKANANAPSPRRKSLEVSGDSASSCAGTIGTISTAASTISTSPTASPSTSSRSNTNNNNIISDEEDYDDEHDNDANSNNKKKKTKTKTKSASEWKEVGNALFSQGQLEAASQAYLEGLQACFEEEKQHDKEQQELQLLLQLRCQLVSNRAVCFIKLGQFEAAQECCSLILDKWHQRLYPKVWYRRALARHGQAILTATTSDVVQDKHKKALLQLARMDLRQAQNTLDQEPSQKNRNSMLLDIQATDKRIQQALLELEQPQQPPQSQQKTNKTSKTVVPAPPIPNWTISPTALQQQQDVLKLLQSFSQRSSIQETEAFFLLDWTWWCTWCRYTFLGGGRHASPNLQQLFQRTLPPGAQPVTEATVPVEIIANTSLLPPEPPGIIDNSRLFLPNTVFCSQWYRDYYDSSLTNGKDDNNNSSSSNKQQQQLPPPLQPPLRPRLVRGYHYELLPREVYFALKSWYGEATPSICRRAMKQNMSTTGTGGVANENDCGSSGGGGGVKIVLYPLVAANDEAKTNESSSSFSSSSCAACLAPYAKSRCTRCTRARYCDRICQESHWMTVHQYECQQISAQQPQQQQQQQQQQQSLSSSSISSEHHDSKDTNDDCQHDTDVTATATTSNNSNSNDDNSSNMYGYDYIPPRGLNNLGNTCFMNSAVQALSHATPLTRHFLSNQFLRDLNVDNPLGTGGKLAFAYNTVLRDLWMIRTAGVISNNNSKQKNGNNNNNMDNNNNSTTINGNSLMTLSNYSTSPTALKRAIALFAPRFAGCLQHDAQEFLAYLLDGLHEDLNRIHRAPYVELPDVNDHDYMPVAGARAWEAHLRRNDSLVLDTFYGQFRSTCVCPLCQRVSVSFDAFNHVSLEIPSPPTTAANNAKAANLPPALYSVLFVPSSTSSSNSIIGTDKCNIDTPTNNGNGQHPSAIPVRYGLELQPRSFVHEIQTALSEFTSVPASRLVLCEIHQYAICRVYGENSHRLDPPPPPPSPPVPPRAARTRKADAVDGKEDDGAGNANNSADDDDDGDSADSYLDMASSSLPDGTLLAYDVDPFSSEYFHVVASHELVIVPPQDQQQQQHPRQEQSEQEEQETGSSDESKLLSNQNTTQASTSTSSSSRPSCPKNTNNSSSSKQVLKMGLPFMTSFPGDFTCRQAWEHIWSQVRYMVEPPKQTQQQDDEKQHDTGKVNSNEEENKVQEDDLRGRRVVNDGDERKLLRICVCSDDNNGLPSCLFPVTDGNGHYVTDDDDADANDVDQAAASIATAATTSSRANPKLTTNEIPRDLEEPLVSYLGQNATERFLVVTLEWQDPSLSTTSSSSTTSTKEGENGGAAKIDLERFAAFRNDKSWIEGFKRQQQLRLQQQQQQQQQQHLVMNGTRGVTLDQCFETFTKPERLDEQNMWYCSRCKEHVRAMKTMELWRLPNILIVHLKRFEFKHFLRRDKLDTFVDFPLEGLDMSKHCAASFSTSTHDATARDLRVEDQVPAVYDLFGVVNHYGRMGFGHYTAFARRWDETMLSPEWTLFDDSTTRSVGDGRRRAVSGYGRVGMWMDVPPVVSPAAYVLFYRRRVFS